MNSQVTSDQLEDMRHALGLPRSKKPYRNQFYTERDDKGWNDLVDKGLAKKGGGWEPDYCYFKLTLEGVRMVYRGKITPEMMTDLRLESGLPKATETTESA